VAGAESDPLSARQIERHGRYRDLRLGPWYARDRSRSYSIPRVAGSAIRRTFEIQPRGGGVAVSKTLRLPCPSARPAPVVCGEPVQTKVPGSPRRPLSGRGW